MTENTKNTKEDKSVMAYSLFDMGVAMNGLFAEGYTIKEGWPIQYGYMYEIIGERDIEKEVVVKKAVRPAKEA